MSIVFIHIFCIFDQTLSILLKFDEIVNKDVIGFKLKGRRGFLIGFIGVVRLTF